MGRAGQIAAGLGAAVVLALILTQVFLPGIAASRISSRVGRYGAVESVQVKAWPALKLLWGSADSVGVKARSLSLSPAQAAKLLWEARGTTSMSVTVTNVQVGRLRLSDVRLRKRGGALSASARMAEADVSAALPRGLDVRLLGSEDGQVQVRASGGLFGVGASVNAVAGASEGRLVARPVGLLGGLQLTLFSDQHVYVEGVGARAEPGLPPSYRLSMTARFR
jgi:LmeA-like phospholipid-binding